jgi:hypothetical protein
MINRIYVNGCSWTDGDVLEINGLFGKLGINGKGRDYSYPTLVGKYFNYNIIDESRFGGSLNRITRMVWEYMKLNIQYFENTVYLLELPNGFRDEVYSNKYERFFNISSGSLLYDNDATETSKEYKSIRKDIINMFYEFVDEGQFKTKEYINFMNLLFYLKTKNIPFFILQPKSIDQNSHLFNDILDEHNVIEITDESFNIKSYDFIQHMCKAEKLSIGDELNGIVEDTHPGISGHKKMSEIIIKHMEKYVKKNIIYKELKTKLI